MTENQQKAKRYHDDGREVLKLFVRAHAAGREAQGLPALPSNPKDSGAVSFEQLSAETGIAYNDLRRIIPELKSIQAQSKVAPRSPKLLAHLAVLDAAYKNRPVPVTVSGAFAYAEVSRETGVPFQCFKRADYVSPLCDLMRQSGTRIHVPLTSAQIVERLERFASELIETSAPLPWAATKDTPNFAEIGRRTGIDGERLKVEPLRSQFDTIFAKVARPPRESKDAERARLAAYVDAQLAERRVLPLNHKKTTAFKLIAGEVSIAPHRLQLPHLEPEMTRWRLQGAAVSR